MRDGRTLKPISAPPVWTAPHRRPTAAAARCSSRSAGSLNSHCCVTERGIDTAERPLKQLTHHVLLQETYETVQEQKYLHTFTHFETLRSQSF